MGLEKQGLAQSGSDPGYYIETLDDALYGTRYSMLLLAQRSTLDVLDKTAVVANEYFGCGMPAARGNEKVVVCGQVWVLAGGQAKVPSLVGRVDREYWR
jgi:hypothetical protein